MKQTLLITLLLLSCFLNSFPQSNKKNEKVGTIHIKKKKEEGKKDTKKDNYNLEMIEGFGDRETIFTIVEQMPEFPGGDTGLMKFLTENIKYPTGTRDNAMNGIVYCQFVIDIDGSVTDVKVVRGIPYFNNEAIRVIKSMPPWKPGKQSGKVVRVQFTLPIKFSLN